MRGEERVGRGKGLIRGFRAVGTGEALGSWGSRADAHGGDGGAWCGTTSLGTIRVPRRLAHELHGPTARIHTLRRGKEDRVWCTAEERRGGRGGGGQVKGVPEGRGRVVLGSFYVPGYALPLTFDQGTAIRGFVEAL